jgi:purine-binding chemotaxis protein CheW
MGHQKDKLEAGLEDLFSTPKRDAQRSKPTPQALTPSPDDFEGGAHPESTALDLDSRPIPQTIQSSPSDTAEAAFSSKGGDKKDEMVTASAGNTPSSPRQRGLNVGENAQDEQLVVFRLAGDDYGLSVMAVARIIKPPPITVVPRTSPFIEGLTNLRGTALPVIDLRRRFGLPEAETTSETRIIVVEVNSVNVGLRVDTVTEVLRVPTEGIEPPSPIVKTVDSDFVRGIAKVTQGQGARLIILLDLARVLITERWATAMAPAGASVT